jgi:hypothetical protein
VKCYTIFRDELAQNRLSRGGHAMFLHNCEPQSPFLRIMI